MTKIILDSNIIIRYPKLLGLELEDVKFIIPTYIIFELMSKSDPSDLNTNNTAELIEKAKLQGTVDIIDSDLPEIKKYLDYFSAPRLDVYDKNLLAVSLFLKNNNENVELATTELDIVNSAALMGVKCIGAGKISELLSKFVVPINSTNSVQSEILAFETKERMTFFAGIFIGIIATALSVVIYFNLKIILQTINIWGTIILILLFGIGLFICREKQRLSYGVFELAVGILAIIMLFKPIGFNYSQLEFNLDFNIKLLGGLYIMVRGQDNIVRSQKGKKIGLLLKDKFGIGD